MLMPVNCLVFVIGIDLASFTLCYGDCFGFPGAVVLNCFVAYVCTYLYSSGFGRGHEQVTTIICLLNDYELRVSLYTLSSLPACLVLSPHA
jgi:hypothetical protein